MIHPLSLSETLTGARTLCSLVQGMGWLLPSYLPSTRVSVSASALKVGLFTVCGKKESSQPPADGPSNVTDYEVDGSSGDWAKFPI